MKQEQDETLTGPTQGGQAQNRLYGQSDIVRSCSVTQWLDKTSAGQVSPLKKSCAYILPPYLFCAEVSVISKQQ